MGRDTHHGSSSVISQHVVSDPHRQRLAVQRVDDGGAGEDAALWTVVAGALQGTQSRDLCLKGLDRIPLIHCRQALHHRMVRSEDHVTGTGQRVWPGGEHRDVWFRPGGNPKLDLGTFRATDPVGLHGANTFRPATELIQILQ